MGVLCIFLIFFCYYDYRYRRIPNMLLLLLLITGLVRSFMNRGIEGLFFPPCVMVMLVLLLYPFFQIGALGAGDVKLLAICSGFLSSDKIIYFLFFSMLIAVIISILILIAKHNIKEYRKQKIPMAGPVFLSILLYMGGIY